MRHSRYAGERDGCAAWGSFQWRRTMSRLTRSFLVVLGLVLSPAAAFAQGSIIGTVRDSSGAILPGVTVEASSPALIEKTRSVTSNNVGQYAIEDLRPGIY